MLTNIYKTLQYQIFVQEKILSMTSPSSFRSQSSADVNLLTASSRVSSSSSRLPSSYSFSLSSRSSPNSLHKSSPLHSSSRSAAISDISCRLMIDSVAVGRSSGFVDLKSLISFSCEEVFILSQWNKHSCDTGAFSNLSIISYFYLNIYLV